MIISEQNTKAVFVTLVCISLGALLGVKVKSEQAVAETSAIETETEIGSEISELS